MKVRLIGEDGNAFAILGRVCDALRRAGYGNDFIRAYKDEATSGDYNHLLNTTAATVEIE